MVTEKIQIELENNRAVVKIEEEDGTITNKYLSFDTLYKIFAHDAIFNTGILPSIVDKDSSITVKQMCLKGDSKGAMIIEGINLKRNISYYSEIFEDIQLPNIYMGVKFDLAPNFRIRNSYILASYERIYEDGPLFLPNFPNLYNSPIGSICWGDNSLASYTNQQQLIFLIDLFFDSNFNNDLYPSDAPYSFKEELERVQRGERFSMREGLNYSTFANMLFDNL